MTKILVWNIEKFSDTKISTASFKGKKGNQPAIRLAHILDTLKQNRPDIFSIIELVPGYRPPAGTANSVGKVVKKMGELGCIRLLNAIQATKGLGANWRIVPPLISGTGGYAEGVAVFYDRAKVKFMGPYEWPANVKIGGKWMPSDGPAQNPVAGVNKGSYPQPWNQKKVTSGTEYAAQFEYYDGAGNLIDFPTVANRAPYLTRFQETTGTNPRKIDLYSIHTSPSTAVKGTAQIATIPAFDFKTKKFKLKKTQVVIVAGDFNVTQNAKAGKVAGSYNQLTAKGFIQEFDANKIALAPGGGVTKYDYVTTHLRPFKTTKQDDPEWRAVGRTRIGATPWGSYPSYGYMSSSPSDTLDNIFTKYPKSVNAGYPGKSQDRMIVNRVVGAPYNPPAALTYPVAMAKNIPWFHANYPPNSPGATASFRQNKDHYRKVRLTSDHMAVYVEV